MTETDAKVEKNENKENGIELHGNNVNLETLKEHCKSNAEYFANDTSENGQRLYTSFLAIIDNVSMLYPALKKIEEVAPNYDFDENTPANGYRSFLKVVDCAVIHTIQVNKKVSLKRDSVLFRKAVITKEVEACAYLLSSLNNCLNLLLTIMSWCSPTELFPIEKHDPEEVILKTEKINRYCYYGRCLGFQFCDSIRPTLQFVALAMAVFSEAYFSKGSFITKAKNSVTSTATYLTDPEQRAKRIVNVSQTASIDFCKSFWFLSESELMHHMPTVIRQNAKVSVTKIIHIPPEPLTVNINGKEIEVPIPESHIGRKPLQVRLISSDVREGMIGEAKSKAKVLPPAQGLLFHCHGGGFVAQSSKSHEVYLKLWAKELDMPILSVDYSLAPQAPYPRALEETTYAFCWALKNSNLLGSTGENIVAAGDSAGANLLLGTSLKCIQMNIPPPNGLFLCYVPTLINFVPSPARLLCLMDPLLPFGFLMRCLKAYAAPNGIMNTSASDGSFEEISHSDLAELEAHKSPISQISDTLADNSFESQTLDEVKESPKEEFPIGIEYDTDFDDSRKEYREPVSSSYSFIQQSVTGLVNNLKEHIGSWVTSSVQNIPEEVINADKEKSVIEDLKFQVPEDPLLSPYLASSTMLRSLPPVKILTVEMDPCLDDCVMFAKKLKALNHNVTLDVLEGLPHGFLNFSMFSKEAYEGAKLGAQRIKELFNLSRKVPKI